MRLPLVLAVLCSAAVASGAGFAFKELGGAGESACPTGRLELLENGAPVFVYNYGMQLKPGAPEDRRRSSYLHPVYTPAGTVVTDDFPTDHYHHRGVFWAWPVVRVGEASADLWTLKGVETRFERWLARRADHKRAELRVENGWYLAGRRIVRERVSFDVEPAAGGAREMAVRLELEALGEPVTIGGAREEEKGYGGLSCRFAPRESTVIETGEGRIAGDENHGKHAWAELQASFAGRPGALRIAADRANGWCLRQYGFVGASFPGAALYRIEPGTPLVLKFRVRVHD